MSVKPALVKYTGILCAWGCVWVRNYAVASKCVRTCCWALWLNSLSVFWQPCHKPRNGLWGFRDESSWLPLPCTIPIFNPGNRDFQVTQVGRFVGWKCWHQLSEKFSYHLSFIIVALENKDVKFFLVLQHGDPMTLTVMWREWSIRKTINVLFNAWIANT